MNTSELVDHLEYLPSRGHSTAGGYGTIGPTTTPLMFPNTNGVASITSDQELQIIVLYLNFSVKTVLGIRGGMTLCKTDRTPPRRFDMTDVHGGGDTYDIWTAHGGGDCTGLKLV